MLLLVSTESNIKDSPAVAEFCGREHLAVGLAEHLIKNQLGKRDHSGSLSSVPTSGGW